MDALIRVNAIFILLIGIMAFGFDLIALKRGNVDVISVIFLAIVGCIGVYNGIKNLFAS
jgi:uncharacterized membrane protein YuzA (DUF378 family)